MSRMLRPLTPLALAAVMLGALAPGAGAAGSVTIDSTSQDGGTLLVSGSATFADQPFVAVGTDPAGDATGGPAHAALGADLTGASIATTATGQIRLRWSVTDLPPALNASPTGVTYGWNFCVSSSSCWELDVGLVNPFTLETGGFGVLWSCADPSCAPGDQGFVTDEVPATFDGDADTVTAVLSPAQIGAAPGATITPADGPTSPVFTATGDAAFAAFVYDIGDTIAPIDGYDIPVRTVSAAIGAPGQDPAAVTYQASATLSAAGPFTMGLDVSSLEPGEHEVYARACFGAGNCAFTSTPAVIG